MTDIEIARNAEIRPIREIAKALGMDEDDLELYGKYKAKISEEYLQKIQDRPDGKLVLFTAINPTPAGEGKTTFPLVLQMRSPALERRQWRLSASPHSDRASV